MVFKALISDLGTVNCVLKLTALTQTLFFLFMGTMMGSVHLLCAHYFCEKPYVQLLLLKKLLLVVFLRGLQDRGRHFAAKSDSHRECGGRDLDKKTDPEDSETC